ncbi:MAG: hypothetical protein FWE88_00890 [Phycisphaerae bacterium]|nr:hypothetical protein [Phycisphaerae bacterium]
METVNVTDVPKRRATPAAFSVAVEACLCGVFILSMVVGMVRFVNPPLTGVWSGEVERGDSGNTSQYKLLLNHDGTFELLNATELLLVSRGRYDMAKETQGIQHIRLLVKDYEITHAIPTKCALIDRKLIVYTEMVARVESESPAVVHYHEESVYRKDMDSASYFCIASLCCSFLGLVAWRVRKKRITDKQNAARKHEEKNVIVTPV